MFWKNIETLKYETIHIKTSWKENILTFCINILKKCHPREDYSELLELTVLYLGGTLERDLFRKPGALHRALFMARVIYSLKMVLFKSQFNVTTQEVAIKKFADFVVWYYVSNWSLAPLASSASRNDLKCLQDLQCWDDNELSLVASKTLNRHLWYLGEELVALMFMDNEVPVDTKRKIVEALNTLRIKGVESSDKGYVLNDQDRASDKTLADFTTEFTPRIFYPQCIST